MRKTLGLLLALTAPAVAHAAEYSIMIFEPQSQIALRDPAAPGSQAYWSAFAAYGKAMADAGVLRGGAAVTPQPAKAEAASLSGYFVVDVPSADVARAWAAKAPAVARGGAARAYANLPMAK